MFQFILFMFYVHRIAYMQYFPQTYITSVEKNQYAVEKQRFETPSLL